MHPVARRIGLERDQFNVVVCQLMTRSRNLQGASSFGLIAVFVSLSFSMTRLSAGVQVRASKREVRRAAVMQTARAWKKLPVTPVTDEREEDDDGGDRRTDEWLCDLAKRGADGF